ncbi:MAG: hypothetical protein VX474_04240 [Pseudomonadota bacterium]|nr:hypothetical protein [Pseudomonadota bacterium]
MAARIWPRRGDVRFLLLLILVLSPLFSLANDSEGCSELSFADIYRDPDNLALNYCYLEQKIAEGDIKSAIPVVERILLLEPFQDRARIIYASLLYHSDMMVEAREEFEGVRARPLPESDEMLVLDYLRRIDEADKHTTHTLSVSLTAHHDNNINNAPDDDTILFYGFEFDFPQDRVEEYGTEANIRYDLNYAWGNYLQHNGFASLDYTRDNYATQDTLDMSSWAASLGNRFSFDGIKVTLLASGSHQSLHGEGLLRSHGAQTSLSYAWDLKDSNLYISPRLSAGTSNDNYIAQGSDASSGKRHYAKLSNSITYDRAHTFYAALGYSTKEAGDDSLSYTSWSQSLSYRWTAQNGVSLSTFLNRNRSRHSGSPEFVTGDSTLVRRSQPLFGSLSVLLPLPAGSDLTVAVERQLNRADIPNYAYRNTRWSATFTKLFSF